MTAVKEKTCTDFLLPASVISKVDLSRLVREVENVDNELTAASIRTKAGAKKGQVPVLSDQLTEFLSENKLSLKTGRERTKLISQLRLLKDKAPVVHMTFAVATDPESLQKLAVWLRTSVHPQAVISVGLQPALVAGVYMRTPNHVHDLSLRAKLKASRSLLGKELEVLYDGR